MSFVAPSLVTVIDPVNYQSELDSNFKSIDLALIQIQNNLDVAKPSAGGVSKITWIDHVLNPDGVFGVDSFELVFSSDDDFLTVQHPTEGSGFVFDRVFFNVTDAFTQDLSTIVTSDGTFRVALGLKTVGAPNANIIVTESAGDTGDADAEIDLLLYDFDVTKASDVFTVTNIRRRASILINRDAFIKAIGQEVPLMLQISGALPSVVGNLDEGMLIPWDCEVIRAFIRLRVAPTDSAVTDPTVRLEIFSNVADTDGELVTGFAEWLDTEDGQVRTLEGFLEPKQLVAGDFVGLNLIEADSDGAAADVTLTLLVKRTYHEIR